MKKTILSIAIVLALFSTAFANHPDYYNSNAVASFQREFKTASDVSWTVSDKYYRATFHVEKQTYFAYYDFQGNLVGLVHHIMTTSLPAELQKEIKKNYADYWVSELFQVSTDETTHYFVQLKNADETIVLVSDGTNFWHRYAIQKNNTEKH
jgi:hypothetical protein